MVIRDSGIVIRDLGLDPRTTYLALSIFFARFMSLSVTPP